jgi:PAS domain S-box-containing protein
MFRIYELDPHSESYNNVAALNHPEDAPFVLEQMKKSRETLAPHDFYYRICLKNGKEKFLHAKGEVIPDENGEAVRMYGTLQDRTQQKLMEKKLQDEQYFIGQIAELTPSIIATYNINTGKYLFINKALQPLLGYDPQEVMVKGVGFFADIIHPDDLESLMEKNSRALVAANQMVKPPGGHEPIAEFTYRMRHKNGEYRWFHTLGTIFSRNKINLVEEVLNISVDVTNQVEAAIMLNIKNEELSKSEERYQQKNEALEQLNQELESFNYVASHDLKEPLRKIKLFTDRILQKNDQLPEDIKEYFSKIISAALRMEQLIDSVLRYSRTSAEERKLVDTDLNVLLSEVKLDLIEDIKDKKAEIEANVLPILPVDPFQFHQLFTNLISNGIKYSQQGVPPVIKISAGMSSLNETDSKGSNVHYHTITFSDNGIGFKQVYAEKIFGLFQRLHPRYEFEGTGIGLAICRKIMQNHEGFIRAKGEPGKGAEFTIYLPAHIEKS